MAQEQRDRLMVHMINNKQASHISHATMTMLKCAALFLINT